MEEKTYMFNGYPVDAVIVDGVTYLNTNKFLHIISNFTRRITNISKEIRHVPKDYIYRKAKKGRHSNSYISGDGLFAYLSRKVCYTELEVESVILFLEENGLAKNKNIFASRKEIAFKGELESFFKLFNVSIDSQVVIDGIIVDFVIDKRIVVEYDENSHCAYDKVREAERDLLIKKKYDLVRVSDKNTNGHNLAIIFKKWSKKW